MMTPSTSARPLDEDADELAAELPAEALPAEAEALPADALLTDALADEAEVLPDTVDDEADPPHPTSAPAANTADARIAKNHIARFFIFSSYL